MRWQPHDDSQAPRQRYFFAIATFFKLNRFMNFGIEMRASSRFNSLDAHFG
jgi:hypothetical protein